MYKYMTVGATANIVGTRRTRKYLLIGNVQPSTIYICSAEDAQLHGCTAVVVVGCDCCMLRYQ